MLKPLKIKSRRYGGGGGNTSTSSTIPEWAVPYIKAVGDSANREYNNANLGNVAGSNPLLQTAFNSSATAIADTSNRNLGALEGSQNRLNTLAQEGAYDPTALKEAAILEAGMETAKLNNNFGSNGTLGSARQYVQQGAQNAATAAKFATIDADLYQKNFQNKLSAEGALTNAVPVSQGVAEGAAKAFSSLGGQAREVEQATGDAAWQALQRYGTTVYGNPARQQTVATGGK